MCVGKYHTYGGCLHRVSRFFLGCPCGIDLTYQLWTAVRMSCTYQQHHHAIGHTTRLDLDMKLSAMNTQAFRVTNFMLTRL